jgi:hypothetical protein
VGFEELKNQKEPLRKQYQNHTGLIGAYST